MKKLIRMLVLPQYVMVVLKGSVPMAFGGTQEPAAYGELVSIGGLNPDVNKKLSAGIASILESKLSIPKSRLYLKFYDSNLYDKYRDFVIPEDKEGLIPSFRKLKIGCMKMARLVILLKCASKSGKLEVLLLTNWYTASAASERLHCLTTKSLNTSNSAFIRIVSCLSRTVKFVAISRSLITIAPCCLP